jgi:hypothetical protein
MNEREEGRRLPQDLEEAAERLRACRPDPSPLELDQIKLRAMSQAERRPSTRPGRGLFMRSKLVSLLLALGLVVSGGTAGVIAGGHGDNNGSGGKGEYRPGKGCGDKNHTHTGPPGNPDNTDCPDQAGGKEND